MTMRLVDVATCPLTGEGGAIKIASAIDAFFGTEGVWTYRENARTGHLWLDPRPAQEHIGELYRNYYTHAASTASSASIWQQAVSVALARRLGYRLTITAGWAARFVSLLPTVGDAAEMEMMRIPAGESGTLLDVGCGSGGFLQRMRAVGWRVMGTEPDPKAAARLRDELGFPVFGSLDDIETQQERFDVITLSHVVEHLPDPLATLQQLSRLLASGGRMILTTPNAKGLGARLFGETWRGLEPPRHFNVFSRHSLAEAIATAGLRVERVKTEVRLARGIFYLSVLAHRGQTELECTHRPKSRTLKVAGYVFQLFASAAVHFFPDSGEEIYCSAVSDQRLEGDRS